jgi:hypothetical protein
MAVEKARGCGYRKVGGLYLCGEGGSLACDRLPYELVTCPTCGAGVKFSRGFQWLNWSTYAGEHSVLNDGCRCGWIEGIGSICPACHPKDKPQPYGLLYVGEQFYTPQSFIEEALDMGVSRRIAAVPRKLKLGETWVLFAHISACGTRQEKQDGGTMKTVGIPGIFYAFRPTRIEKLIWKSDAKPEYLEELQKAGIIPVIIPDGDVDHDPKTPLKLTDEDRVKAKSEQLLNELSTLRTRLAQTHTGSWNTEYQEE